LNLARDTVLFPLKRDLVEKVCTTFDLLAKAFKDTPITQVFPFPEGCQTGNGKITRGENLDGYPYVVLDYASLFGQDDLFTIRVLYWFGHLPSISLVMKGKLLVLPDKTQLPDSWKYNVSDLWQNRIDLPDCKNISTLEDSTNIHQLRLIHTIENHQPDRLAEEAIKRYREVLSACSGSADALG
jgi:hypothetical protein